MRTTMRFGLALALLALVLGTAQAQGPIGKFTLPFRAQWGTATLPAGDYSFKLDRAGPGGFLHLYTGLRAVALIPPQTYDTRTNAPASLLLVAEHGVPVVREMRLPGIGIVLRYGAPKARRGSAAEERAAIALPVTAE